MSRFLFHGDKIYHVRRFVLPARNLDQDVYQRVPSVTAPYRRKWHGTMIAADMHYENPWLHKHRR